MSVKKTIKKARTASLSMKTKLLLSLSSIGAILLISCTISVMEYTRMSDYVSELIADDIHSIGIARQLSDMSAQYHLEILAKVGEENGADAPVFDESLFKARCDTLRNSGERKTIVPYADSLMYSYSAYMLASKELGDVISSDFIDTRNWYFERLQPLFYRFYEDIEKLSAALFTDLEKNSATFDRGFYRSVIPGIVAVGVGLLLIFMLLLFILAYYVNPLAKMLAELKAYKSNDKKYSLSFEGDDELAELNGDIAELSAENRQLRERIKALRSRANIGTEE